MTGREASPAFAGPAHRSPRQVTFREGTATSDEPASEPRSITDNLREWLASQPASRLSHLAELAAAERSKGDQWRCRVVGERGGATTGAGAGRPHCCRHDSRGRLRAGCGVRCVHHPWPKHELVIRQAVAEAFRREEAA